MRANGLIDSQPITRHPYNRSGPLHLLLLLAAVQMVLHNYGRRRPVRSAKTRAVGPVSALWEWDQDENHYQAQLGICTQFGPSLPRSLAAGLRQTVTQT